MELDQQFLTDMLQEFLKQAIPDYLIRGNDRFPLRLSNKKNDNNQNNNSRQSGKRCIFLVCHRISVIVLRVP